jgi:hypothetical protein
VLTSHIKLYTLNRPGRTQTKQLLIQFDAFHDAPSWQTMRESVLLTHTKV